MSTARQGSLRKAAGEIMSELHLAETKQGRFDPPVNLRKDTRKAWSRNAMGE
jgi:hypothetical protein